jgi:peptidoglycan-associated lipoprotein
MNVKQCKYLLLVGVVSVFLAACSSTPSDDDAQGLGAGAGAGGGDVGGGVTTGTVGDGGIGGSDLDVYNPGGLETVFYFDFDKATLRPESRAALQRHAENLKDNPKQIRLEGHADERGTREYNMALGERRANAVRDFLLLNGVDSSLVEVISYGEEAPVAFGSDEASMALNRRVELK